MKSRLFALAGVATAVLFAATLYAADVKLEGVKCLVNPKAAAKVGVDFKKGKVYFCCKNCAAKFAKNKDKMAVAANQQLVSTKQYKQAKCPVSGRALNAEKYVKIGATKVTFCCDGCKGKVAKAGKKGAELVFNDKSFTKGFVVAKKEKKEKKDAK